MGSEYVVNGTETIEDMGYLEDGATIPAGKQIINNGSYAGTPVITSITAGPGVTVINPATPGAATISALSSITNNLADYSTTSLNFSLSTNYNITALNLIK